MRNKMFLWPKRVRGLFFAVLAALLFTACVNEAPGKQEIPADVVISSEELGGYRVIYPDIREEAVDEAALVCSVEILEAMEKFGVRPEHTSDFYREGGENSYFGIREHEILVGETNRPESAEFYGRLQPWQYGYTVINGKVVIGGYTEEALEKAVNAFVGKLTSREELCYLSTDDYLYGAIEEGEGRVYSLLNLTTYDGSALPSAEVITAVLAPSEGDDLLERCTGYEIGGDFTADNGRRHMILYNPQVYTSPTAALCPMAYENYIPLEERGAYAYCVLRCKETQEKLVYCTVDLSALEEKEQVKRMAVFCDFAENTARHPILLGGKFPGSAMIEDLLQAGQTDFAKLAGVQTEDTLYGSFKKIVPSAVEQSAPGQIYCEFMRVA